MRLRLPSLKIEETVDRLLEEKTGQIVGQVMNEASTQLIRLLTEKLLEE